MCIKISKEDLDRIQKHYSLLIGMRKLKAINLVQPWAGVAELGIFLVRTLRRKGKATVDFFTPNITQDD